MTEANGSNDLIITLDDIICTEKYFNAFPNHYYKTDVFYTNSNFEWRNKVMARPNRGLKLLISGHSDYSIHDAHVDQTIHLDQTILLIKPRNAEF